MPEKCEQIVNDPEPIVRNALHALRSETSVSRLVASGVTRASPTKESYATYRPSVFSPAAAFC
jgi:hypothetical protein